MYLLNIFLLKEKDFFLNKNNINKGRIEKPLELMLFQPQKLNYKVYLQNLI